MTETFIKIDPLSQKCCLISHFASWKFWCSFFLAIFLQTNLFLTFSVFMYICRISTLIDFIVVIVILILLKMAF